MTIVAKNIFILGAGASREAGGPLMLDFLDVAQDLYFQDPLHQQARDLVMRAEVKLRAVYATANLELRNIESLWSAIEMAQLTGALPGLTSDEIQELETALRRLVVATVSSSLKPRYPNSDNSGLPYPFYDFYKEVVFELMSYAILTFNYDTALDVVLSYPIYGPKGFQDEFAVWEFGPKDALFTEPGPLYKLHGSVNWTRCTSCQALVQVGWNDAIRGLGVGLSLKEHQCPKCNAPCNELPLIIPPTWSKREGRAEIQKVWEKAAKELSDARNIFVIGYSLPPSDRFFRDLFGLGTINAPLRRVYIYDPLASEVESRWRQFLGPGASPYLKAFPLPFSEAVKIMRNILRKDDAYY